MFEKYGGANWPSVLLPNAFNDTSTFGGFGYGKVIIDEQGIVHSINEYEFEGLLDRMFKLESSTAKTASEAKALNHYWHNNKSWRSYEDVGIPNDDIDRIAKDQQTAFRDAKIVVDKNMLILESISIDQHQRGPLLTINLSDGSQLRVLFWQGEPGPNPVVARAKYLTSIDSNSRDTKVTGGMPFDLTVVESKDGSLTMNGFFEKVGHILGSDQYSFELQFNESILGYGSSELIVDGNRALLSGTLGSMTYLQIKNLIEKHPEVDTIALTKVAGAINDPVNMHTGRIIREAGFNTELLSDSEISSGAVDLFCAGVKRSIANGAKLGIHSWSDGIFDGKQYSKDHPAHQYQLAYFEKMLGKKQGEEFYFYTLDSASAKDLHLMDKDEIERWKIAN